MLRTWANDANPVFKAEKAFYPANQPKSAHKTVTCKPRYEASKMFGGVCLSIWPQVKVAVLKLPTIGHYKVERQSDQTEVTKFTKRNDSELIKNRCYLADCLPQTQLDQSNKLLTETYGLV